MAFHDPIEQSAYSSGVMSSDHEHDGSELVLVAPWWKNLSFAFRTGVGSGNSHDVRYAKPSELANLPRASILVGESPADELEVLANRRVDENRNSSRDAALHEIRRFKRPRATGIKR
jgi:hypothetical protein